MKKYKVQISVKLCPDFDLRHQKKYEMKISQIAMSNAETFRRPHATSQFLMKEPWLARLIVQLRAQLPGSH